MPAPKNIPAETPGEAPAPEPEKAPAPAEPEPAPAAPLPTGQTLDTPELIAAKDAELKRQVAETSKLVGSKDALNWNHLNSAAAVQKDYSPIDPGLPDQADVDPDTITQPVLSKQGWVLPTHDPRARFGGR